MATFVLFVSTPTWEFFYNPEHRSYHFEGRCEVRVFMYVARPFAYPVGSYRFSPASPFGDDMVYERARSRNERILRTYPAGSGIPEYVPLSADTEASEDPPTRMYSEGSAPTPLYAGEGSEDSVAQPRPVQPRARQRERRPGAQPRYTPRVPTPEELAPFIGYVPRWDHGGQ